MGVLRALTVAVGVLALLWKLYQLARSPGDLALRTVTAVLGLLLVAILGTVFPVAATRLLGAGAPVLVQNVCALLFSFLILGFFIASDGTRPRRDRTRSVLRELAVVLVVGAVMVGGLLSLPEADQERAAYGGAMAPWQIAVFFALGNVYLSYAGVGSGLRALRYSRRTDRRTALGLRVVAVSQGVGALVGLARTVSVLVRAAGLRFPAALESAMVRVLLLSLVGVLVGLSLPGVITRFRALRRRRWHQRVHPQMTTLWRELADTFPEGTLERSRSGGSRRAFRSIDRRCYRRAIECRDGLVRISPYLAQRGVPDGTRDVALVAAALPAALRDYRTGRSAGTHAIRILPPGTEQLDDDLIELAALSRALETDRDPQPEKSSARSW